MFDKAIIKLIKEKPEKGMRALMEQYTPLVYSIVNARLRHCCSSEDIEEAVSDVFIAVYNQADKIDLSRGSLTAYITSISKRRAVDKFRKCCKASEISYDDEDNFIEIPDSFNLEGEAERNYLQRRLIDEINALGEPDATIVYRKYFLGETSKEIAAVTGLTDVNVRKRLSRALKAIEEKLKGDYYEN